MNTSIPQFGQPLEGYKDRPSAYAVVFNEDGQILALSVDGEYHLPGGGINFYENATEAIWRETMEEAGAQIKEMELIGQANQFSDDHPINKVGTFYKARLVSFHPTESIEADHTPIWITPQEFIEGNSPEFHKWAVKQA